MFITFNRKKSEHEKEAIVKHSWHVAIAFFIVTILGTVGIGYLVEKNLTIRTFDDVGYEAVINMPHPAWLNTLVAPVNYNFFPWGGAFIPSFIIVGVVLFLLWIFFTQRRLAGWAALCIIIGWIYANILFEITSAIIFRARPFTVLPNNLSATAKAAWISWTSFPSGHTRDTAMFGTIIAGFLPKLRWPLLIFAIFVAFSRVYVGAHYPTDAIGGLIIGFLAGWIALMLTREIQLLFTNYRGRVKEDVPK